MRKCNYYIFQSIVYLLLLIFLSKWLIKYVYISNMKEIEAFCNKPENNKVDICQAYWWHTESHSEDYVTMGKMNMEDPNLIKTLASTFKANQLEHYNLSEKNVKNNTLISSILMIYFQNKTNGFFIEFGAGDGENNSLTLQLEMYHNWNGLLVEADLTVIDELFQKGRKSLISNTCLGKGNTPFMGVLGIKRNHQTKLLMMDSEQHDQIEYTMCYPLYTYLLALNRTKIDLIVIDVNDKPLFYLISTPFEKVFIDVIIIKHLLFSELSTVAVMLKNFYDLVYTSDKKDYIVFKLNKYNTD